MEGEEIILLLWKVDCGPCINIERVVFEHNISTLRKQCSHSSPEMWKAPPWLQATPHILLPQWMIQGGALAIHANPGGGGWALNNAPGSTIMVNAHPEETFTLTGTLDLLVLLNLPPHFNWLHNHLPHHSSTIRNAIRGHVTNLLQLLQTWAPVPLAGQELVVSVRGGLESVCLSLLRRNCSFSRKRYMCLDVYGIADVEAVILQDMMECAWGKWLLKEFNRAMQQRRSEMISPIANTSLIRAYIFLAVLGRGVSLVHWVPRACCKCNSVTCQTGPSFWWWLFSMLQFSLTLLLKSMKAHSVWTTLEARKAFVSQELD